MGKITWGPSLKPGDPSWSDGYVTGGRLSRPSKKSSPESTEASSTAEERENEIMRQRASQGMLEAVSGPEEDESPSPTGAKSED